MRHFVHLKESESEVTQSCPTLCDPMDCNLPGSSVHGIFQARILEWVAISFSRGSSPPRDWTQISCIAGGFFANWATREAPFFHDFSNLNLFVLLSLAKVFLSLLMIFSKSQCSTLLIFLHFPSSYLFLLWSLLFPSICYFWISLIFVCNFLRWKVKLWFSIFYFLI